MQTNAAYLSSVLWWKKTALQVASVMGLIWLLSGPTFAADSVSSGSEKAGEASEKSENSQEEAKVVVANKAEKKTTKASSFNLPDGLKWETNLDDPVIASPKAKKGGTYYGFLTSFPVTFRAVGPNSNSGFRGYLDEGQMGLLSRHPNTKNFLPSLATHWAVAKDNKTVYYKLDKRAKWSDGTPVTAEDFLFKIEFMRSPHIVAPWYNTYYTEEIEKVVVHSPEVISVVSGKEHMKTLLLAATSISPAHKSFYKLDKDWVKNYNWKVAPVTGPYRISSWKHGKYVTLKREKNWWAKDDKYYKGTNNFDTIHLKVIPEMESVWQNFITGKLTSHGLTMASYYHEKARGKVFDKGYIKKLWFYTDAATYPNILWINKTREPWSDKNIRYAFAHALNFDKVNEKLLRGEYIRQNAFAGGHDNYDNSKIKAREFSIEKAESFMKLSGWSKGDDGYWQKDGKKLTVKILLTNSLHQDRVVLLKEEARKAGFDIEINLQEGATGYKTIMEKSYDILWAAWNGAKFPPPRYWQYFHSEQAIKQSNNFTMTSDPELDKLIDSYKETFNEEKKQKLSQEILQFIHDDGAFIPGFINPFVRTSYWRHIMLPEVPGTKRGPNVRYYGWIDEEAEKQLKAYQKEGKSFGKDETINEVFRKKVDVK